MRTLGLNDIGDSVIGPRIEELERQVDDLNAEAGQLSERMNSFDELHSPKSIDELLKLVVELIRGADKDTLKQLYQSFITQVTFDKKDKLVWVELEFDDDVATQLKKQNEEAESKQDSASSFIDRITFQV